VSLGKPPVEGVPSEDDEPAVGFGSRPGVALVPGVCGPPVGLLGDVVSPPGNPEGGGTELVAAGISCDCDGLDEQAATTASPKPQTPHLDT